MNDFQTVYNLADEPMKFHWLIPLAFVLIGAGIIWFNIKFKDKIDSRKRAYGFIWGSISGGIALIISIILIPHQIGQYFKTKAIFESREYKIIEGIVKEFDPMPYSGHKLESFKIDSVKFEYSDFDESYYGFNKTKSHGGPIDSNKIVRIQYITKDDRNIILKLEIKK